MNKNENTIQQLIYEAQNKNIEAKKQIINHYTKYTIKIIENTYNNKNLDKDKLLQAGIDAINYSIIKYRSVSSKFCDYVVSNIKSRLTAEARFQQNLKTHNKQAKFYIGKTLQGDDISKEELAKYYIKQLDRLIENNYNSGNYDLEELRQAGCLGIATALNKYNKNLTTPFSTFVKNYIKLYISKEITNQKEKIDTPIKTLYNDFISDIENLELIKLSINKLENKERNILILRLCQNYTFQEIGNIYNLTRSRIQQLYKESLETIKEEITSEPTNKKKIKKQSKSI